MTAIPRGCVKSGNPYVIPKKMPEPMQAKPAWPSIDFEYISSFSQLTKYLFRDRFRGSLLGCIYRSISNSLRLHRFN